MTRVTTKTVIIPRSFILNEMDGEQPPGIYTVETEESPLEGHSISAVRRISTTLSRYDLTAKSKGRFIRFLEVDPEAIDAVQIRSSLPPP
jgi:hypothetical protein